MNDLEHEIADLEQRLHALDSERAILTQALATLRQQRQEQIESFAQRVAEARVTHQSSRQDKIKLFRALFKGREDVYPKRFESSKTGKTGYSPVCLNDKFAWWANLHGEAARRARGMDAPAYQMRRLPVSGVSAFNRCRDYQSPERCGQSGQAE